MNLMTTRVQYVAIGRHLIPPRQVARYQTWLKNRTMSYEMSHKDWRKQVVIKLKDNGSCSRGMAYVVNYLPPGGT